MLLTFSKYSDYSFFILLSFFQGYISIFYCYLLTFSLILKIGLYLPNSLINIIDKTQMASSNIKIYFFIFRFIFYITLKSSIFYLPNNRHIINIMVKDSLINKLQGTEILQKFFQLKCDLDLLSSFFEQKNRTKEQLKKFIKNKFTETILEIESELFRANKIQKLTLFDHASDQMFDELSEMGKYFPQKLISNFLIEEKTKQEKMEKSTTSTKMQIYSHVLKYAKQQDLLKFVFVPNQTKLNNKGLKQRAKNIYDSDELEVIYLLYSKFQAHLPRIIQRLADLYEEEQKFNGDHVYRNIKNLELIGLYKCINKSIRIKGGLEIPWQRFIKDDESYYQTMEDWNSSLKGILMKLAIRNEIKPHHIRMVCKKIGRKFSQKSVLEVQQPPPLKDDQKICETVGVCKLRQELLTVLNAKVEFNNYSD